jgi:hypothetical protein
VSILYRLQQQRVAAQQAATQVKPQELSQGIQAQVQSAGLSLVKNNVQVRDAGQNGQLVKPQERKQEPPTQGW